mmetsp:Transcript_99822/g.198044  ORF Transcript_99822/g.198044 Transcript_99822/m.198044 type:complete len:244 (-) Transcript_99822:674-1405(-)|eukprot:CAMPEP_0172763388 /NCGR_PEP_ID=MMETSP1074-20121228/175232_1 /TAXON_ID=2916 /ORGANISM="Ceratium fusus, Strain PA161109" /LENGTH=243 /DNA_ID=CAMNT_0013597953 /DNA_START=232 /DNA_END=963 /DNA_ORIENTATION=-
MALLPQTLGAHRLRRPGVTGKRTAIAYGKLLGSLVQQQGFLWPPGRAGSQAAVGPSPCAAEAQSRMVPQAQTYQVATNGCHLGWGTGWAHPSLGFDLKLSRGRIGRSPPFALLHRDANQSWWRAPAVSQEMAVLLVLRNMVAVAGVAPFLLHEGLPCAAALVAASTPLRCMKVPLAPQRLHHNCRSCVGAHRHQHSRLGSLMVPKPAFPGEARLANLLPERLARPNVNLGQALVCAFSPASAT